jgi:long-subunit fatty acid transport protein
LVRRAAERLHRCALAVAAVIGFGATAGPARAAGLEHPDLGTVALGRAGAYAADPVDGYALQYNPAGFAKQTGLRITVDSSFNWQGLTFTPMGGAQSPLASASNGSGPFWEPGGAISYGLGPVGPLSGLTFAFGVTGPSAIGKQSYPANGPQRYSLISSDFFIAYYSASVAASWHRWLSAGLTFQLVKGSAKFSQAVWSGTNQGTDPAFDAIATVDVNSGFIPTGIFGVTVRPVPRVAVGLSYRPHFTFDADGTLTTQLPAVAAGIGAMQTGNSASFTTKLADVIRLGTAVDVTPRVLAEADIVIENWSPLQTIEIHPHNINVESNNFVPPISKPLPNIVFPKNYGTSVSLRLGGEYVLLPGMVTVRGGYLFESSAIPIESTNVDFGNWTRHMLAVGGSYTIPRSPVTIDVAYAHHFVLSRTVTNSNVTQIVTPCLTPGCADPPPTVVGNGTYEASLNTVSLSVRVVLDGRRLAP